MRKIYFVLLCVSLFGFNALAQTRPRVTPTPAPRAPETVPPTAKRPPVLIGDTRSNNPSPAPTPPVSGEDTAENDDEIIRVETNLVTMPVSVLDRDGRFIAGLRQQDFQILEDGVPQKIDSFASVEKPFTVVLLIDVSPSTQYKITEIQDAAISFVNQLRQDDRVIVMSFDERIHVLSPPTSNRGILRNAILQAEFGNGTSLYEAVDATLNQQLKRIEGRKAVVLFTDGVDTTSNRASYETNVRDAEESEALIYPIRYDTYEQMSQGSGGGYPNQYPYPRRRRNRWGDVLGDILGGGVTIGGSGGGYPRGGGSRSAGSSREDYETGERYLEELAKNSGGRIFQADSYANLENAFAGIAEELRRQYTLGYYPENAGQPGQRKQIRVRVLNRQGAVVRAKTSYIVGGTENATTNQTPTVRQPPRIMNRLPF